MARMLKSETDNELPQTTELLPRGTYVFTSHCTVVCRYDNWSICSVSQTCSVAYLRGSVVTDSEHVVTYWDIRGFVEL
jgi:hypothetical protein